MPSQMVERIGELIAELHEVKEYASELEARVVELEEKTDNRKKLRPFEVRQIRALWDTRMVTQKELADQYGVNPATISRIVNGVYYAEAKNGR